MEILGSKYLYKIMCRDRIRMLYKQGYDLDVEMLCRQAEALPDDYDAIVEFAASLYGFPKRKDFPYDEPDDLDAIRKARPDGATDVIDPGRPELELRPCTLRDRIYGGVYGRIAACMLGKPLEVNWKRSDIERYLKAGGTFPLDDYISCVPGTGLARASIPSCREYISCAQADDDTTYFAIGLRLVEDFGRDFTTQDVARFWLGNLPYGETWGPEHTRYLLLGLGLLWHEAPFPQGEEWDRLTSFLNDGEELIGAMIRGDAFGLMNPGRPGKAAELAWRDGMLTHRKTGLYAEMWVAATLAAAFYTRDPVTAIRQGLAQIPENSRYAEAIRQALEISVSAPSWEAAYPEIDRRWGALGHAGTFNETAAIINALVHAVDAHGLVDYEKAICATVMHGWDTDCSAATCGCIAGVLAGYHAIPEKWIAPLHDTFYTYLNSEQEHTISGFADRLIHAVGKV